VKYLLDTCVISEMIKSKPDKNVISWLEEQNENSLYLSVLTFGEIEKGIEKASNQIRKQKLRLWVEDDLKKRFEGRIIPISFSIAVEWGKIQRKAELLGKPMPTMDGLISVSGFVSQCTVVTRNILDMEQSLAELFNPWKKSI